MSIRRLAGIPLLLVTAFASAAGTSGGTAPGGPAPEPTCYELYAEVSDLLARADQRDRGFWDRRETRIAAATWLVYPIPASLYLGYATVTWLEARPGAAGAEERIRTLRGRLADKQCFVR